MVWQLRHTTRDLSRLYEIVSTLIYYGFGDIVQRLGLAEALSHTGKAIHWSHADELANLTPAQRVRRVMEELGATFIKLGQILATRVDLFPPEWIAEFERLQHQAPPVPFDDLRPQLEADLGAPPETVFAELQPYPIGAASIAQTHRARLADGNWVVLKIRRPGIELRVESDLRLLTYLAALAEEHLPDLRPYQPTAMIRQFARTLRRELDLASECRYAERIAANMRDHPVIVAPKVYWQWTGERLNVQEFIAGIPGRDLAAIEAAQLDRQGLAAQGAAAILTMVIRDGFFHADPHPGNLIFLEDNRIALLDYGMVGRVSERRRRQLVDLLLGLVERNAERVVEILLEWSEPDGRDDLDEETLSGDVAAFIDQYHSVALQQLDMADMLLDMVTLFRDHALTLPPDLALMFKVFLTLEGFGRQLDPDFDMAAVAQPLLRQAMLARYAPDALWRRAWQSLSGTLDLLDDLPHELRQVLTIMRRDGLHHQVVLPQLEPFGDRLDRAVTRLAVSLVTSAFVLGTSLVVALGNGPTVLGIPIFEVLSLGAVLGGIWVLVSVWRSRSR